ncbi:toll/interleukin-1 receptor domain-containing protein [Kibdelosporangium aridum]|uniref:toll/interleukin-1 receptor domain-containing protein n=1 Tax=Kibdelosporangium aridum TaxID=2030 RepID=UPI00068F98F8
MTQIFLNYRTDDDRFGVAMLDDKLSERFGAGAVFRDSKSIPLGADWERTMFDAVAASTALLVVMGRNWLDPRLADPQDFVRREILLALQLRKQVIPVRLDTPRLSADDLPPPLRPLVDCQDIEVRFHKEKIDIDMLADKLRQQIPGLDKGKEQDTPQSKFSVQAQTIDKVWQSDTMTFTGDFYAGPPLAADGDR